MKIAEITEGTVFARSGKGNVTMKYRCDSGPRKGRIVAKPADCGGAVDPAKRAQMKKTRARTKTRAARRAKFTKRTNVASRIMKALNSFKRADMAKRASAKKGKVTDPYKKRPKRPTRPTRPKYKKKTFK